jgi:hypothetical protein
VAASGASNTAGGDVIRGSSWAATSGVVISTLARTYSIT